MNIKLMSLGVIAAASFAMAQDYGWGDEQSSQNEEATEVVEEAPAPEPAPAPAPAPVFEPAPVAQEAAPAAPAATAEAGDAANFNVLRGNAYNTYGNEAAASTIGGNMASPYKMAGSKLVYVDPLEQSGVVAFGDNSTYFLGLDNSNDLGKLTLGFAKKSFGISLDLSLDKTYAMDDNSTTTTIGKGDNIGVNFGMLLGSMDLTINAYWLTIAKELNNNKWDDTYSYWDLGVQAAITNGPSNSSLAWNIGVDLLRHNITVKGDRKRTSKDSRIEAVPHFNIASAVLQSNNARVLLGLNTYLPVLIFDGSSTTNLEHSRTNIGLYTMPNLLAELALSSNWLAFAGVNHTFKVVGIDIDTNKNTSTTSTTTTVTSKSDVTEVEGGTRFQYKNFAVEAAIGSAFYKNPLTGFNGGDMFTKIAGFINF